MAMDALLLIDPGLTNARPISPPAQGAAKARPYCQGREPELAQQQHSQERFGRHDQPADEQVVEIERPQGPSGPRRLAAQVGNATDRIAAPSASILDIRSTSIDPQWNADSGHRATPPDRARASVRGRLRSLQIPNPSRCQS
jgi:hypothetical protein